MLIFKFARFLRKYEDIAINIEMHHMGPNYQGGETSQTVSQHEQHSAYLYVGAKYQQ